MEVKVKLTGEIKWPPSFPGLIPRPPGQAHLDTTAIAATVVKLVVRYIAGMCTEPPRQAIMSDFFLYFYRGLLILYLNFSTFHIEMTMTLSYYLCFRSEKSIIT